MCGAAREQGRFRRLLGQSLSSSRVASTWCGHTFPTAFSSLSAYPTILPTPPYIPSLPTHTYFILHTTTGIGRLLYRRSL
ncbi:hypothetical protein CLOM_g532 [Closterium sp. NIES-68]|nr:hypothetical protein CLOM_g532 [Closterium sp. NIES-68]